MAFCFWRFILLFPAAALCAGGRSLFFRKRPGGTRRLRKGSLLYSAFILAAAGVLLLSGAFAGRISAAAEEPTGPVAEETDEPRVSAPDFTLEDQYGQLHTLSDYQGKVVFMNFWTTWCPWCITEMPDIEALYHEMGENREDVVFLGMAAPGTYDTAVQEEIVAFLEEHGWTYPVLMDATGAVFQTYVAEGFPTTWLIRPDGSVLGYIAGALTADQMKLLVEKARE